MEAKQLDKSPTNGWDYIESYEFFNHVFNSLPAEERHINYPDWVKLIQEDRKLDGNTPVTFSPMFPVNTNTGTKPSAPWTPKFDGFSSPLGAVAASLGDKASATVDQVVDTAAKAVQEQISRKGQEFADFIANKTGLVIDDGGDGSTTKRNYAGGSNFNPSGLSLGVKPINSSFRTELVPLGRPKYYNDGADSDVPLILIVGNTFPEIPSANGGVSTNSNFGDDQYIQRYLYYEVFNDWEADICRLVKLNAYTKTLLTREHILNFIRITSYALSVYYFYASVIAHVNVPENRNEGMIKLYEALSAQDLRDLTTLKRLLLKAPIDGRINQFVFHYFNNYKQSHLPGSPLYKMTPIPFATSSTVTLPSLKSGAVAECINLLGSTKYREFVQLFVQAYPNCDSELLAYTGIHNFDADHITLAVNAPKILHGSSDSNDAVRVPTVTSDDDRIVYNCHTDAPDGWVQASSGMYTSSNKLRGGFGGPKGLTNVDNDFAATESLATNSPTVGGMIVSTTAYVYWNGAFYPSSYWTNTSDVCGFTYDINRQTNQVLSAQHFGAQLLVPVTVFDTVPMAQQFADLMYSPPKSRSNTSSRRRPPGRRGKSKEDKDSAKD